MSSDVRRRTWAWSATGFWNSVSRWQICLTPSWLGLQAAIQWFFRPPLFALTSTTIWSMNPLANCALRVSAKGFSKQVSQYQHYSIKDDVTRFINRSCTLRELSFALQRSSIAWGLKAGYADVEAMLSWEPNLTAKNLKAKRAKTRSTIQLAQGPQFCWRSQILLAIASIMRCSAPRFIGLT